MRWAPGAIGRGLAISSSGGVWNGERILPEGYTTFVSTLAPAWAADNRPIYGAFFWLNGDGQYPVPRDAYYMAGAGGQTTLIIPRTTSSSCVSGTIGANLTLLQASARRSRC